MEDLEGIDWLMNSGLNWHLVRGEEFTNKSRLQIKVIIA